MSIQWLYFLKELKMIKIFKSSYIWHCRNVICQKYTCNVHFTAFFDIIPIIKKGGDGIEQRSNE